MRQMGDKTLQLFMTEGGEEKVVEKEGDKDTEGRSAKTHKRTRSKGKNEKEKERETEVKASPLADRTAHVSTSPAPTTVTTPGSPATSDSASPALTKGSRLDQASIVLVHDQAFEKGEGVPGYGVLLKDELMVHSASIVALWSDSLGSVIAT